jgi:DNA-binding MarR family transcriptional regulator
MLGIDVSGKLHNALNGLNFVKAFYTAYNSSSGLSQEKVSILHMEAFLFLIANQDHDGIPLLNLQEALGHAQAKMQRLAVALQKVGWITLKKDPNDGRQRIVYLTEKGLALFDQLSPCFSEEKNDFVYQTASKNMRDSIAEKALEREVLMGAENIIAGAAVVPKASMNVTVEVDGVSAKGEIEGVKGSVQSERDKNSDAFYLKADLRAVLAAGQPDAGKIEVGAGYVRTDRGIVTYKVLLKRLRERTPKAELDQMADNWQQQGMADVVEYLKSASDAEYESMLTPTPKTRRGKLEAEMANAIKEVRYAEEQLQNFHKQFDSEHMFETPSLKAQWVMMQEQLRNAKHIQSLNAAELTLLDEVETLKAELREAAKTPEQKARTEALIEQQAIRDMLQDDLE